MSTYDICYLKSQGLPCSSFSILEELDEIFSLPWSDLKEILLVTNFYISDDDCFDSRQLKELLKNYILPHLSKDQVEFLLNNYAYRKVASSEFSFRTIDNVNGLVHGVVNFYNSPKDWPFCLYEKDYMKIINSTQLEWDSFVAYLDNMDESRICDLLYLNLEIIQLKQLYFSCKYSLTHTLIDKKLRAFESDENNYNTDIFSSSKIQDYIYWSIKMTICHDIHAHFNNGGEVEGVAYIRNNYRERGLIRINAKRKEGYAFEYMNSIEFNQGFMDQLSFDEIKKHILTRKCCDYFHLKFLLSQQAKITQQVQQVNIRVAAIENGLISNWKVMFTLFFVVVAVIFFV